MFARPVTYLRGRILCVLSCAKFREDASIARRSPSRLCPLHRDEFVLGIPMCVYVTPLQHVGLMFVYCPVQAMQSQTSVRLYKHSADVEVIQTITPFISMKNHYSLLYREEEREIFSTLQVLP
jgi:hypothetical protein